MNSAIYQYYPLKGDRLTCVVCGYSYRKDAPLSTLQKHLRVKHQFSIRKPLSSGALDQAIQDAKEPVFSSYVAPGVYIPQLHKAQKNPEKESFTDSVSDSSSKPSTNLVSDTRIDQTTSDSSLNSTKKSTENSDENLKKAQKCSKNDSQTHSSVNTFPTRNFNSQTVNLGDKFTEALTKGNLSSLLNPTESSQESYLNSESIEEALVDWILSEKIPLSSVTAPSFQALLHQINSSFVVPSSEKLRLRLAQRFEMVMGCNSSRAAFLLDQTLGDNVNSSDSASGFPPPNLLPDNDDLY